MISASRKNYKKKNRIFSCVTFRFCSHEKCHYFEWACFRNEGTTFLTKLQIRPVPRGNSDHFAHPHSLIKAYLGQSVGSQG